MVVQQRLLRSTSVCASIVIKHSNAAGPRIYNVNLRARGAPRGLILLPGTSGRTYLLLVVPLDIEIRSQPSGGGQMDILNQKSIGCVVV